MKSVLVSSASALALFVGLASAQAADIPPRTAMPAKAPAYVAPVFNWTGPYIGINGGWGWGNSDFSGGFPGSADVDGGLIGGTLGYNWQMGAAVVGLEGDIDWSDIRGSTPCTGGVTCTTRNHWLGTVRGRLGYNGGQFMPYVTGGLAVGDIDATVGPVNNSTTKAGWTLGAGVEANLWGPVSAKLEYLYVDLGRGDAIPGSAGTSADFRTNIIRAGLNYHF
jgi:outer membrane immunogenic protein